MRVLNCTAAFASVGLILICAMSGQARAANADDEVGAWLHAYEAAFNAKDLVKLASFYDPDVTIYEGGGVNTGWVDYRDHHLGPELAEMDAPRLSHASMSVHFLGDGQRAAYVISEYRLQTRIKDRDIDASGLETLVIQKGGGGTWKIRHSHTSSRRRPTSSPSPPSP